MSNAEKQRAQFAKKKRVYFELSIGAEAPTGADYYAFMADVAALLQKHSLKVNHFTPSIIYVDGVRRP